jgi:hypothetical protein
MVVSTGLTLFESDGQHSVKTLVIDCHGLSCRTNFRVQGPGLQRAC